MSGQRVASFAWQMLGRNSDENADAAGSFLSPISLYVALGMALNGAGTGSTTQQQLYRLLNQDSSLQQQQQGSSATDEPNTASTSCCMWPASAQQQQQLSNMGQTNALQHQQQQPVTDAEVDLLTAQLSSLADALLQQQQQQREKSQQEYKEWQAACAAQQPQGCWTSCCFPLGSGRVPNYGVQLVIASAVWTRGVPVHEQYAEQMRQLFQAEVREVSCVKPINEWAARATKGLIPEAVPEGQHFDLLLTNAVYFKGLWQYPFMHEDTKEQDFTLQGGRKVMVNMMSQKYRGIDQHPANRVKYAESKQYQAVRLPYKWSTISAVIVLPSKQLAAKGIAAAAARLSVDELLSADIWKPVGGRDICALELFLPKFTVKSPPMSLKKELMGLGLAAPFSRGAADFSRLSSAPDLAIDEVLQSVYVSVNEEGTEAAALSSVCFLMCGVSGPTPTVRFDRPFLFMLVDDVSSTPLFLGTVWDPSKQAH